MPRKPRPQAPRGIIDTRLKITDVALCCYLREQMKREEREVNQQIIFMLRRQMTIATQEHHR